MRMVGWRARLLQWGEAAIFSHPFPKETREEGVGYKQPKRNLSAAEDDDHMVVSINDTILSFQTWSLIKMENNDISRKEPHLICKTITILRLIYGAQNFLCFMVRVSDWCRYYHVTVPTDKQEMTCQCTEIIIHRQCVSRWLLMSALTFMLHREGGLW